VTAEEGEGDSQSKAKKGEGRKRRTGNLLANLDVVRTALLADLSDGAVDRHAGTESTTEVGDDVVADDFVTVEGKRKRVSGGEKDEERKGEKERTSS